MKFTVNTKSLLKALATCSPATPRPNTPKPILLNAKIYSSGDEIRCCATDSEMGIDCRVASAEVVRPGQMLLPLKRVQDLLSSVSDETTTVVCEGSNWKLLAGSNRFSDPTEDVDEFPALQQLEEAAVIADIAGPTLAAMLGQVAENMDPTSTSYVLGGVCLQVEKGTLSLIATDTRALAVASAKCEQADFKGFVIPGKLVAALMRIDEGRAVVSGNASLVSVQCGDTVLTSRLLEGRFPRWKDVIPEPEHFAAITPDPMLNALRQARFFVTEESRGVDFTFSENNLNLKSPIKGESEINLPISYAGPDLEITLDPLVLTKGIKAVSGESSFRFGLTDSNHAILIDADCGFRFVCMPMSRDR